MGRAHVSCQNIDGAPKLWSGEEPPFHWRPGTMGDARKARNHRSNGGPGPWMMPVRPRYRAGGKLVLAITVFWSELKPIARSQSRHVVSTHISTPPLVLNKRSGPRSPPDGPNSIKLGAITGRLNGDQKSDCYHTTRRRISLVGRIE